VKHGKVVGGLQSEIALRAEEVALAKN
jgi:hypothetical protein